MPEQLSSEPTIYDVLVAMNKLSEHMDRQFAEAKQRDIAIESKVSAVESKMVTKEYLDEKLAEHSDEPIKMIHGTDDKVKVISKKLTDKKIFSPTDHQEIIMMKPFAGAI